MSIRRAYIPDEMVEAFKIGWHQADEEMGTAGPPGYRTRAGLEEAMTWLTGQLGEGPDVLWIDPPGED